MAPTTAWLMLALSIVNGNNTFNNLRQLSVVVLGKQSYAYLGTINVAKLWLLINEQALGTIAETTQLKGLEG
jgi:hypothetical protein